MPSCRPTHTHTHPPCHLAARHRSEPCPPAPASRCTATLHFRCPAAVLMRKPAPERKPELKPGPDPPYGNTPRNRRFRRASTPVNNSRRSPPQHTHPPHRPTLRSPAPRHPTPPPNSIPPRNAHPRRQAAPPPHIPTHRPTAIRRRTEDSAAHSRRQTAPGTTVRLLTTEQPAAHSRRQTTAAALLPRHTPTHAAAPEHASVPGRASNPRPSAPAATPLRRHMPSPATSPFRSARRTRAQKAKHPCGCFASLWKRGVRYSPRAKRL